MSTLDITEMSDDPWDHHRDSHSDDSVQDDIHLQIPNSLLQRGLKQATDNSSNTTGRRLANYKFLALYDLSKPVPQTDYRCLLTRTHPPFHICVYEPERDKYISASLLTSGVWEPYITPLVEKALACTPKAILIDIGANIGYYSLLAAAAGHSVIAVEPSRTSLVRFHKAARLNNLQNKIDLLLNAISDQHENVTLTSSVDNQGGVWIKPVTTDHASFYQQNHGQSNIIQTTTMNHLLDLSSLQHHREAIIKLDIEGFECRALAQGQKLFEALYIPYIFMEWRQMFVLRDSSRSPCPQPYIQKMTNMLTDLGYVPYEVRTGFELDPSRSATDWKIGDVYWQHVTAHELQDPY